MVARLFSIITIILCSGASCEKERATLRMSKTPYTGNELRIDGYYYSSLTSANDVGVAVFYRDGVCIHTYATIENEDTLSTIEKDILLNSDFINLLMTTPTHIGVFKISGTLIEFETWSAARDITTFSHFGDIINDTTFMLKERINNEQGHSHKENLTYHFQEFSPKPDSTNRFIK